MESRTGDVSRGILRAIKLQTMQGWVRLNFASGNRPLTHGDFSRIDLPAAARLPFDTGMWIDPPYCLT